MGPGSAIQREVKRVKSLEEDSASDLGSLNCALSLLQSVRHLGEKSSIRADLTEKTFDLDRQGGKGCFRLV